MKKHIETTLLAIVVFVFFSNIAVFAQDAQDVDLSAIEAGIGPKEAVLVADPSGKVLFSKHADRPMIPASTLKVLTVLAGFHHLGKDYRFATEFYLDDAKNLTIKGYGDPYLVSEEVAVIAERLAPKLGPYINELIVNDSFFAQPLVVPGTNPTTQPYDAPNGALSVNFNTVNFKRGKAKDTYVSAEPQTPLLPFALDLIRKSKSKGDRITLSHNDNDIAIYAGRMFRYFLEKSGVETRGQVWRGWKTPENAKLIHKHQSSNTLEQMAQKLLEFSNNFIANQVFLTFGAEKSDPPADYEKGAKAMEEYAKDVLKIEKIAIREGSGISRENRISADEMLKVVLAFRPHCELMKKWKNAYYKSGTLHDVNNLVGYLIGKDGRLYPYVIFVNKRGKKATDIIDSLVPIVK